MLFSSVYTSAIFPIANIGRTADERRCATFFRHTLGMAPHKWLIEQRVALSKEKLRDDRLSLASVAAECGFCDQSHFTQHFTRIVGVSPGAWRRALKE